MGKWAAFVLGMLMVPSAWGAWWVFTNVKAPGWAWFATGITATVAMKALREIAQELQWALRETDETVFRRWFRPIWRMMRRMRWAAAPK